MNREYLAIEHPSERIQALLDCFESDYRNRNRDERIACYENAFREHEQLPFRLQRVEGFCDYLTKKEIVLREYDLLAGNIQHYPHHTSLPMLNTGDYDPYYGGASWYDARKEAEHYLELTGNDPQQAHLLEQFCDGTDIGLLGRWGGEHVVVGHHKVVRVGLGAIIREGELALELACDERAKENASAMVQVLRAAQIYIQRNAQKARDLAEKTENAAYRVSLLRIAEACEYLVDGKPRSFFEALQLFLLTQDMILCEGPSGSMSLGRMDQWLYPFYEQDLKKGLLDQAHAQELLDAVWIKLNMAMEAFQHVTLGGMDEYGRFAGNELSLLCMRASLHVMKAQPLMCFRWHEEMPECFWKEIITLIRAGLGFPALFHDEAVMEAKLRTGVSPEEVWNYAIVGCVEPTIPGNEYSCTESLRVTWAKILELMFFDGVCPLSGVKMDMAEHHDLDEFETFEDFYAWYKREMAFCVARAVQSTNMLERSQGEFWTVPFLSSTMENPFRSGRDITQGGTKYTFSVVNTCGMADTVDSLYAIKELVFDRKLLTLQQLAEVLKADFEGYEVLRKIAENLPQRFGTDSDVTNELMQDLGDYFSGLVNQSRNWQGNRYQAGFYTVGNHVGRGSLVGALPCGRKARKTLANSLSPCQGVDTIGPTATVNSILSVDAGACANGVVLDMKFLPQFLENETHQEGLRNLIRTYFKNGGMEIQFNVVSRETLLKAKKEPEKYKNLVVRVSGYSANFVYLDPGLQDEIIARTEFGGL